MARIIRADCKTQSFFPCTVGTSNVTRSRRPSPRTETPANKDRHGVSDGALARHRATTSLAESAGQNKEIDCGRGVMSKDNINASAQAMSVPSIAHGSEQRPTTHADRSVELPMDVSRWQNIYFLRVVDVLAKHQFLRQLEREKRRTDRSKASLSIALFHLDSKKNDELGDAEALLKILRNSKRETDTLGYLGQDLDCASPSRYGRGGDARIHEKDRQSNRQASSLDGNGDLS